MSNDAAEAAAVAEAENESYRLLVEGDYDALAALFHPELRYVHSDGVSETREQYLERLRNGRYAYEAIGSQEVRTTLLGEVALQTGVTKMSVSTVGGPMNHIELRSALVWAKQDGKWTLLLRQATRIK